MRNKSTSVPSSLARPATGRRKFAAFTVAAMLLMQHLLILAPSQASAQTVSRAKAPIAAATTLAPTAGSVSLTTLGSAYTQNFDTLSNTAGSTTNDLTIPGWYMTEGGGGARDNEQYAVDTGASTTGDTYSYGAAGSTERALGQLRSGTLIPLFGASFTNNTGATITSLNVAYTGEEWRLGTTARTDQMNFEYSTNATDLSTGTWTGVSALNFVTPDTATAGAKNGNAAADRTALSSTINGLSIPNGATFWVRWNDTDATGADDGLAIDDFSITPSGSVVAPNLSINDVSLNEGNSGTTTFSFTVGLSSPAPAGGVTFDIATADGTATAPGDYTAKSLTGQTIPQGSSSYTFDVLVNGDTTSEPNETFFVNVTNVTGATVTDGQGQGTIVNDDAVSTSPTVSGSASPSTVTAGNVTLLTATVTPGTNPASSGITVSANLSSIGGSATQTMFDDGTNGDVTPGDNVFSYNATVAGATSAGAKSLALSVSDAQGRTGTGSISLTVNAAGPVGQPLPFSQDWSNTNLISTNDDWSGVPGIVGYRGDDLTTAVGADPQTILADGSGTPVNVLANQTNPNTLISGGIAEFELANPVVAFQGSGTSDAPNLVISVNTTGASNIVVSYNLRDIDGSTDNAVQPVALQYRVGASGNYTNIPAAFVADASDGPSDATLVTPVTVLLPAAAENQPLVQLRIITANATGSDEFIGIDDINVSSNGTLPLGATGSASPSSVLPGGSTLLKATVSPATNPSSTGISVIGDLSAIGGSATQAFYDDGTNGDQTAGDNVYSYNFTVGNAVASDIYSLPVMVGDAQLRTTETVISLTVGTVSTGNEHLTMGNPSGAVTDVNSPLNYLMSKPQYALSYNRDQGKPNWVSWHLDSSWIGGAQRQNDFRPDSSLPAGWYQVTNTDYSGSGFDRGHNTPSGDRTRSVEDNSATFLMTNMMPQAGDNNQGPWEQFESYCRTIAGSTNELYIVTGSVGTGGTGSNGYATTIAGGNVTVPEYTWKVVVVLPIGSNDVSRVTAATRTIGIIMPNKQGIRFDGWQKYVATVDQVEALTGYDFFSNVPANIQDAIESKLDSTSSTSPQSVNAGTYTDLAIDGPNTTLNGDITVNGVLTLGGSTLYANGHKITLGPNATVKRISGMVNGTVEKQFDALGNFEYPVGTGPFAYSPVTMSLTALGTPGSKLSVMPVAAVHPNAPDPTKALKRYWKINETGDLTGNLTFKYVDADIPAVVSDENSMDLYRYEGSFALYPQTNLDTAANTIATTQPVSSFSDWTLIANLAPTAAGVTVSGRVTRADGIGIGSATVRLVGPDGNTYSARSNTFGYFQVQDVPAGKVYIADAAKKGYRFAARTVVVQDSVAGVTIVSQP